MPESRVRVKKPRPRRPAYNVAVLPQLPAHHHVGPCKCEHTIGYVRVSKVGNRDDEDLKSPQIQVNYIVEDAKKKGKRIVKLVFDINKSGYLNVKRSVESVIDDIGAGIAKSVTVWKWSRWGRNPRKSLVYLEQVAAAGGRVDSATEDMDPDTAAGELGRDIVMAVDKHFSRAMSDSWKSVQELRRRNDLPHSGRERFGYQYFSKKDIRGGDLHEGSAECSHCIRIEPHFVVDPVEGPALVGLYERYNSGASVRSLTQWCNEAGFVTSFGARWSAQALSQMMDTGFAAGLLRERSQDLIKQQTAQEKRIRNSLSSFDVWRHGEHPALIAESVWEKYKARRLAQTGLPARSRSGVHALSALLVCDECGRRLSTKYAGATRTHQWVCSWASALHPSVAVTMSNSNAMKVLHGWVAENKRPHESSSLADLMKSKAAEPKAPSRTVVQVEREIQKANSAILKIKEGFEAGLYRDAKEAVERRREQEALIVTLKEERMTIEAGTRPDGRPPTKVFDSLEAALDVMSPADLSTALRKVIAMVVVRPVAGSGASRGNPGQRVTVVGRWEAPGWEGWLAARRTRAFTAP